MSNFNNVLQNAQRPNDYSDDMDEDYVPRKVGSTNYKSFDIIKASKKTSKIGGRNRKQFGNDEDSHQ